MSFSEYREAKVGHVYSTFASARPALSAAQRAEVNRVAKLRRAAYKDAATKTAWKDATSARRSAAARARAGIKRGPNMDATSGYFMAHADQHGLQVSKEAVKAINALLVGVRKDMIHRATAAAISDGAGAVLGYHVAQALGAVPGMRTQARKSTRGL